MTAAHGYDPGPWQLAVQAAHLFAVDPCGVVLCAQPGATRAAWLALVSDLMPGVPWRRVPAHVDATGLLGGLDLAATLAAGRPLATTGVLAASDGGVVELAMAERLGATAVGIIAAVLDDAVIALERDGLAIRRAARCAVIALDESAGDDAPVAPALADRLGLRVVLDGVRVTPDIAFTPDRAAVSRARALLAEVAVSDAQLTALTEVAAELRLSSLRPVLAALRVARAAAALDGMTRVDEMHLALAVSLVMLPRARQQLAPAGDQHGEEDAGQPDQRGDLERPDEAAHDGAATADEAGAAGSPAASGETSGSTPAQDAPPAGDSELDAAAACLPPGLLEHLARLGAAQRAGGRRAGRATGAVRAATRGRPLGSRPGRPGSGVRLDLVATLRAAAPWQRLRARGASGRVAVRQEDLRVRRFKARAEMTTVFVIDASGSSAAHRLAEAKGAIELLLAECYVRRDRVAVITFRGASAEVLLAPTRSLVRAKRALAHMPAGGGTPLAAALEASRALAERVASEGSRAQIVLLTDGRPNVNLAGCGGGDAAMRDALVVARGLRADGHAALVIDVAPRPRPFTAECAAVMGAAYLALPRADAATIAAAASTPAQRSQLA